MKELVFFKALLVVCLSIVLPVQAQKAEDSVSFQRSDQKVVIGGQKYYIHIVEENQTLYAISKVYDVPQKQIARKNPGVVGGLEKGEVLKIPYSQPEYKQVKLKEKDKYIYHVIEKGETLFSVSQKYDVPVETLVEHNPEVEYSNLQINQVLKIPKKRSGAFVRDSSKYIFHKVKKKETLYSLSQKYNISIRKIKRHNKRVKKEGLKYGSIIRIPKRSIRGRRPFGVKDTLQPDTTARDSGRPDTTVMKQKQVNCDTFRYKAEEEPLKVALLLPFMLEENEAYNRADTGKESSGDTSDFRIYPPTKSVLKFYEGGLMALQSLQNSGHEVNLYTYDTQADSQRVKNLLRNKHLDSMDLIIGPAYHYNFQIVGEFAKKHRINIVSPLSNHRKEIVNNPYAFQVNPSTRTEISKACQYLTRAGRDKNIVMIYSDHVADYKLVNVFKKQLQAQLSYTYTHYDTDILFKEVECCDTSDVAIKHALSKEYKNIVVIPSERETFVSKILNEIHPYTRDFTIQLFGLPIWPRFKSIELDYFYDMAFTYYTPFYIDFEKPMVKQYIRDYRKYYHSDIHKITSEGYNFSMLGYDVCHYFVNAIYTYGTDFRWCIDQYNPDGLQTSFHFTTLENNGGYENQSVSFVRFDSAALEEKKLEEPLKKDTLPFSTPKKQEHQLTLPSTY